MKNIMNKILSVFKEKNKRESRFNDIYGACRCASEDLGYYCKIEGLSK